VEDCVFRCGDDCIALKSGRDADGWRLGRPTENIVIRRIEMEAPYWGSGLALGSEMSGGVRTVFAEDIRMGYAKTALNFKGNLDRGGALEQVRVRRVVVAKADTFLQFTTDYHGYRGGNCPPRFRDFVLENLSCMEAEAPIHAVGRPEAALEDITLRDVTIVRAAKPPVFRHVRRLSAERVEINGRNSLLGEKID
jgi:polygalacturonase